MEYTTYLFDFDYTLVDSSKGIVTCYRIVLERHGYTGITDETIKKTIGKTLEDSFSIMTGVTDKETLAIYKNEYTHEASTYMTANTKLFPETKGVLTLLKQRGAKIGIISTKYKFRIEEFVNQHFPKGFFDVIVGAENVNRMKPDPQGVETALSILRSKPDETLYVGDSIIDAETAQNAHVNFTGVLHGTTTKDELKAYPHIRILENLTLLPYIPPPKKKRTI